MVIRRLDTGAVVVERADDEILVAAEFVHGTPPVECIAVEGDVLTVTASNGTWRYRVYGFDAALQWYECRRLR